MIKKYIILGVVLGAMLFTTYRIISQIGNKTEIQYITSKDALIVSATLWLIFLLGWLASRDWYSKNSCELKNRENEEISR